MTKGDTVLEIMRLNRSADAEFLGEFSEEQLTGYLQRLSGTPVATRLTSDSPQYATPNRCAVAGAA